MRCNKADLAKSCTSNGKSKTREFHHWANSARCPCPFHLLGSQRRYLLFLWRSSTRSQTETEIGGLDQACRSSDLTQKRQPATRWRLFPSTKCAFSGLPPVRIFT